MECEDITKIILPAVRINMAEQMRDKYHMKQQEIASRLGVAQVAVSKYLNGRYSRPVGELKERINARGLVDDIAAKAAGTQNTSAINGMINELCSKIVSTDLVN